MLALGIIANKYTADGSTKAERHRIYDRFRHEFNRKEVKIVASNIGVILTTAPLHIHSGFCSTETKVDEKTFGMVKLFISRASFKQVSELVFTGFTKKLPMISESSAPAGYFI
ncbi:hypothetical protein HMPREF1205_01845 [Bacteroides fragilis HMW 616]|nr:hypothetical protein HMPREF1205_01845 [Bacteroides fragilis HMW 616]